MRVPARQAARGAASIAIAGAALLGAATTARAQERDREDVRARERYLREALAYPGALGPTAAIQQVFRWRTREPVARSGAGPLLALLPGTATWSPLGPYGIFSTDGYYSSLPQAESGRVPGVAFDPSAAGTFYVASAGGGVWKTTTGGAGWTPLTDGQCSLNMGAIAVDPVNPSIVYAGTGELDSWSPGCGVLRSTDGGSTWQVQGQAAFQSSGLGFSSIGSIVIDPGSAGSTTGTTVYLGDISGVYRSTNSGATWALSARGTINSIVVSGHTLFAGNADLWTPANRGLMRSTDEGITWTTLPLPPNVIADSVGRLQLAVSAADPRKVVVAIATPNWGFLGLYRWDDATSQWTTLAANGIRGGVRGDIGTQAGYDLLLAVDPIDANRIYLGGIRLYRSLDGGATFTQIAANIHCDWHTMQLDPHDHLRLLAGSDGGVFLSQDGGDSWLARNIGLQITQYYQGLSVQPNSATSVTAGAQDNGSQTSNGMPEWSSLMDGDGAYTAINYANPAIRWAEAEWFNGPAILRVQDGLFQQVNTGISTTDRAAFLPPLVMSPITPTTLYFGTQRLYRTTDEKTWVARSTSTDLTTGSGYISVIAPAPSDSNVIYVGTNDGLVRASIDGGVTFATSGSGLPGKFVSDIAVDGGNPRRAIATVSSSGIAHVWLTTDGGATWTSISGSGAVGTGMLPDLPTHAIVIVPSTGTLLVGTSAGVWQSADSGATWQPGPGGLPNVDVMDLVYNPSTQQLVAATFGRGVWTAPLAAAVAVLRGDVNHDGVVNAQDALLVQDALVGIPLGNDAQGHAIAALPNGDANCDNLLGTGDVLDILRAAVGLTTPGSCAGQTKNRVPGR